MAKDPAFLFYSADFYMGTVGMTDAQVGKYIRLMCLQHQQGALTEALLFSVMGKEDPVIMAKFVKDEDGMYYNMRLHEEIQRRVMYSESRRQNRSRANKKPSVVSEGERHMSNICESHDEHMETETETETITINTKKSTKNGVRTQRHKYGEYQNVLLTDDEFDKLKAEFSDWKERIERLSEYIASKGVTYKNHLATIRSWAKKDAKAPGGKRVGFQAYDQGEPTDYQGIDLLAEAREQA